MTTMTIITREGKCYCLWQVDITDEDYVALLNKYGNTGYSVLGRKEDIIQELREGV